MSNLVAGFASGLGSATGIVKFLFGLALHIWATFIAYEAAGALGAVLTFILPVLAEVYWVIALWQATGVLFTTFTVACLLYVALWVAMAFFASMAAGARR